MPLRWLALQAVVASSPRSIGELGSMSSSHAVRKGAVGMSAVLFQPPCVRLPFATKRSQAPHRQPSGEGSGTTRAGEEHTTSHGWHPPWAGHTRGHSARSSAQPAGRGCEVGTIRAMARGRQELAHQTEYQAAEPSDRAPGRAGHPSASKRRAGGAVNGSRTRLERRRGATCVRESHDARPSSRASGICTEVGALVLALFIACTLLRCKVLPVVQGTRATIQHGRVIARRVA